MIDTMTIRQALFVKYLATIHLDACGEKGCTLRDVALYFYARYYPERLGMEFDKTKKWFEQDIVTQAHDGMVLIGSAKKILSDDYEYMNWSNRHISHAVTQSTITLKEYLSKFSIKHKLGSVDLYFCNVKSLPEKVKNMDFVVYLPSKKMNLQREFVWTDFQCVELIYSILLDRYIPPIRFISLISDNRGPDKLELIDGKQRITSLLRFLDDKFSISIDNKFYCYSHLPSDFKNRIDQYVICGQPMYQDYDEKSNKIPITDQDKIKWFYLINFSGTPQNNDHLNKLLS